MDERTEAVACTLKPQEAAAQLTEWADVRRQVLSSATLTNSKGLAAGVRMTFPEHLQSALEELALRESTCCAFLGISVRLVDGAVSGEVTSADPAALPTIGLISGLSVA